MSIKKLKKLFNPKVVAIIGASAKVGSVGHSVMRNIIGSGFDGIVYPINPKRTNVLGVKAYPNIESVPDKVDLAIIATPAKTVPGIVESCGKAGVAGIVLISAGFTEIGEEGQMLTKHISASLRRYGMRMIGPNCLGFIKPSIKLNASFANKMALPGKIAFISQSGALCTAILDWSVKQNVGFSHFVSIGSMLDVGFHDLIDFFGDDPQTTSILIYMESLSDARSFMSAARAFARNKPIIVLKAGTSSEGAQAAMSHTGSLAGNDFVFDAAFKRAGVIRVDTIDELFNMAQSLAMQQKPAGNRIAIITNAGGPGVIATDTLIEMGGKIAKLSDETIEGLNENLSPNWSRRNPVDVLGDAGPEQYAKAVELCAKDKNVDGLLVVLTPQAMTDPTGVAKKVAEVGKSCRKTLLASWMGADDVFEGQEYLENHNVPVYQTPEDAIKCFMLMYNYSRNLEILHETPSHTPREFKPENKKSRELIDAVLNDNRAVMTEFEAKQLLKYYDIPVIKNGLATTEDEAVNIAEAIGYPLVMKIASPDILHKTDVGGVILNIVDKEEARKAYNKIIKSSRENVPDADIRGVFVEQMTKRKYELIIGTKRDPIFGPIIVFGMGGVAVEIFKDTTVGLPPLNMALAMRIIEDTKIYKLIRGYRGMPGADITAIQFLLYKFAYLVMDFPQILEIDINPFGVDERGGVVLDAKVVLDESMKGVPEGYTKHLVISPYPSEYITEFTMKNGEKAILRPIKPEDEFMEKEMFSNFSERTQRFRFFQLIKDISHQELIRYTQIDYDREMAIIAEVEEDGKKKMAGVVRLIADQYNETAEYAIVVADPWHNLGLGNKFTDYITEIAKKRGIQKIYANVLAENHIMLHMFRKRGYSLTKQEDSYYAELIINEPK
ncbi:MAG TPA: bifunctional acyl-CoA synthetase/GNAT family N-acetyltransferase [Candidatus Cloacimonetes bacterium]|nr:bifunctional acyl-CoA synthetase/GNAT family N-acetyltransferase [Candidatus Cloacimonadota bacterium]HEX37813.1 bifunctional acyl-CoA synthetase/GNAT family N-acetyltransferase [Candidatus Cloacimonadota bacterium]